MSRRSATRWMQRRGGGRAVLVALACGALGCSSLPTSTRGADSSTPPVDAPTRDAAVPDVMAPIDAPAAPTDVVSPVDVAVPTDTVAPVDVPPPADAPDAGADAGAGPFMGTRLVGGFVSSGAQTARLRGGFTWQGRLGPRLEGWLR